MRKDWIYSVTNLEVIQVAPPTAEVYVAEADRIKFKKINSITQWSSIIYY